MIKNLLVSIFRLPQYEPAGVVVPMPNDCRVKVDRKALLKEYEALKPQNVAVNRQGKTEVKTETKDGLSFEIIGNTASSVTAKTNAVQRVQHLTDYDKMFIVMAKLDSLKAARVKVKWATIRNGKYLTNKIIAHELNETGMGERNVATYTSAMSQALEMQQKEAKSRVAA